MSVIMEFSVGPAAVETACTAHTGVAVRPPHEADSALVTTALYHSHLPRLADAGYIDWDRQTGVLSQGPRFTEIEPMLVLLATNPNALPFDWP